MAAKETALRKRQQIASANRMMFIWIAAISVVVGIAIVVSIFLVQKAWFNEKVLLEKNNTASTLEHNNSVIEELKDEIRVLNTNEALRSSMASGETQPIQVVLDALPADANSSALGASLQEKFLNDPALTIETLSVDPVAGVEALGDTNVEDFSASEGDGTNQITFRFSVSTGVDNASALKSLLQRLERSIRAINVTMLNIETQGSRLILSVEGYAFYEPARSVELRNKTVTP
jgi:cytoskeletal protein RodZ